MTNELWWDDEDAAHIRSRSERYPGSIGIEPEWTLEAAGDVHRVVRDPDPRSRAAYVRIIGYSPRAGFVLTVIVEPDDWSGSRRGRRAERICANTWRIGSLTDGRHH